MHPNKQYFLSERDLLEEQQQNSENRPGKKYRFPPIFWLKRKVHYDNFWLLSVNNSIQEGVSKVHLNFALKWWDSFICGCICQKNMIKKQAPDHIFNFKTLSFYHAFVCTLWAHFSFFAFCANFPFCHSHLLHRTFVYISAPFSQDCRAGQKLDERVFKVTSFPNPW